MLKIYPYKVGSASARALKAALGGLIIKTENSRFKYKDSDFVINWGNSTRAPHMEAVPMLNIPEVVAVTTNKLTTLQHLEEEGISTVDFTTEKETAEEWLSQGHKVFVRNKLNGHSGDGIEVIKPNTTPVLSHTQEQAVGHLRMVEDRVLELGLESIASGIEFLIDEIEPEGMSSSTTLPTAPLYTRGVRNKGEYRVHVFDGEVILYQKKSRRVDDDGEVVTAEGAEADVRNLESNWIYRTGNLKRLERVEELALDAVSALMLDFGAVDIIMEDSGDVRVLEVNSAPGLGNTQTLEAYVEAINNIMN